MVGGELLDPRHVGGAGEERRGAGEVREERVEDEVLTSPGIVAAQGSLSLGCENIIHAPFNGLLGFELFGC